MDIFRYVVESVDGELAHKVEEKFRDNECEIEELDIDISKQSRKEPITRFLF